MTIMLSPDVEKIIADQVKSGIHPSAEACVEVAINKLVIDQMDFEPGELDALCATGLAQIERGEVIPADEVFDELEKMSKAYRKSKARG